MTYETIENCPDCHATGFRCENSWCGVVVNKKVKCRMCNGFGKLKVTYSISGCVISKEKI